MRKQFTLVIAAIAISPSLAFAAEYAPVTCSKAKSASEKAICKSYELGQADARMATLYGIATSLVGMGRRADIQEAQRNWLDTRDACGKRVACLKSAYETRIGALSKVIDDVVARGPF